MIETPGLLLFKLVSTTLYRVKILEIGEIGNGGSGYAKMAATTV